MAGNDVRGVGKLNIGVDANTRSVITIPYEHHEVHDGNHYTFVTYDEDFDNAETIEYLITAPASPVEMHLVVNVSGAATTLYQLFEDSTRTTTDTASTAYNNNRNSTDTATLVIQTHSTTDGADGTQIDASSFGLDTGVGAGSITTGGSERSSQEWILKFDAVYLLKVTSNADNNNVTIRLSWYEHTSKA